MTKIHSAFVIGNMPNLCVYLECLAMGSVPDNILSWSIFPAFNSVSQKGRDVLYMLAGGKQVVCYLC